MLYNYYQSMKPLPRRKALVFGAVVALVGGLVVVAVVAARQVFAFNPPSNAPGVGGGALSADSSNNIGVGVAPASNSRFTIQGATADSSAYGLIIKSSAGSNIFTVRNDARVVIGTVASSTMFSVGGDIWTSGTVYAGAVTGSLAGTLNAANVSAGAFASNTGGGNFSFPAGLTVDSGTLFVDSVNDRVGIGTTGPNSKLAVAGTISVQADGRLAAGASYFGGNTDNYIDLYNSGTGAMTISAGSTVYDYPIYLSQKGATVMTLKSGNVGIGTAAPAYNLHVVGSAGITGTANLLGGANLNGQNITGVNKLTVTTIDPIYQIGGVKYATYGVSLAGGVREEYVGRGRLDKKGKYVIDFDKIEEGDDLWLWRKVVDFSEENVEVIATPKGYPVPIAYNIGNNKIVFMVAGVGKATGTKNDVPEIEFSYRLVGKRLDWRDWPTRAKDQSETPNFVVD